MSVPGLDLVTVPALERREAMILGAALAGMDPWLTLGFSAEALARVLSSEHPDLMRYLAVRDGETLGLAVVRHPWLRGAYIELFAVLPGAWGQGVGQRVLCRIETDYRPRAANLWLLVSAFNGRARDFYAFNGFQRVGLIADLIVSGQDEILMRKVLSDPVP